MRILFLSSTYDTSNGWGRYATGCLGQAKKRLGEENAVAIEPSLLRSLALSWTQPLFAVLDALRFLRLARSVQAIHALNEPAAPLASMLAKLAKKPYLVSIHGTWGDLDTLPRRLRSTYRRAFRAASAIVAVSRYTAEVVRRSIGADSRVEIIHGGFNPQSGPKPKAKGRGSGESFRVLSVGALKRRKGFHTLVDALIRLHEGGVKFHADFAGNLDDDGYVLTLTERVRAAGLTDSIIFKGEVSEEALADLYSRADLFVMPSEHAGTAFEGLGLVYLEALSYGVPVIGCLESGAEDVIKDGVNGRLVPPGNAAALSDAIRELLADESKYKTMSEAAPASIEPFRWEAVGEKMHGLYLDLVAPQPVTRKL